MRSTRVQCQFVVASPGCFDNSGATQGCTTFFPSVGKRGRNCNFVLLQKGSNWSSNTKPLVTMIWPWGPGNICTGLPSLFRDSNTTQFLKMLKGWMHIKSSAGFSFSSAASVALRRQLLLCCQKKKKKPAGHQARSTELSIQVMMSPCWRIKRQSNR